MENRKTQPKSNPNLRPKKKNHRPEAQFRHDLDTCSKNGDLSAALALYQSALSSSIHLSSYHYNTLLHLCSSSIETLDPSSKQSALDSSFQIFDRMIGSGIVPNEATITTMSRIAAHRSDGGSDLAFDLVKTMKDKYGAVPKLRSFGPAIFAFCGELEAEKAYDVEELMISMGISPEEAEVAALLKVSAKKGNGQRVYEYLLKLRSCAGSVISSTAEILEDWFESEKAAEFGSEGWDLGKVKDAILMNGGGWHGLGWLGKGRWEVRRGSVSWNGDCCCCGQRLVCVDVEEKEAEKFAESVATMAMERETKSNFKNFQEWLETHADYEAIIDGANIALYQQNFADGGFSLSQLDTVVRELYKGSQSKWPLVILHNKRCQALMENPSNRQLLGTWRAEGALYTTPNGSNDDWYWLYAAVKLKCLLVTNDEMRDHIFEILGRSFFPNWKERHQAMAAMDHQESIDLPAGFRFHPTDEEIITHYLSPKVLNPSFSAQAIGEVDLNKSEPWDLPSKAKMGEKEWYFFCQRDRKYPTGMRTNRATEAGYWKATGKDREIFRGRGVLVGMKKTLVFYRGRAPKGEKSNWVMHEFRLEGNSPFNGHHLPKPAKDEWVVCKVFHKSSGGGAAKKSPMMMPAGQQQQQIARMSSFGDLFDSPNLPPLMGMEYSAGPYNNKASSSSYLSGNEDDSFDFKGILTGASPFGSIPGFYDLSTNFASNPAASSLYSQMGQQIPTPNSHFMQSGYLQQPEQHPRQCKVEQFPNHSMLSDDTGLSTDRNTEISSVCASYDDLGVHAATGAALDLDNMWKC